ncbi:MAG: glycosyltransferase family 9 protein, partial [Candidatus Omnitrophica bacterium]|nr:glycosyltransferase family 9 protein [Candidatus Omnitrophota bacterium]
FNPFGIGDVVFSTPLIRGLRASFPEARITYISNRRVAPVLKNDPCLDGVIVFEKDEFRALIRRSRFAFLKSAALFFRDIKKLHADLLIDLSLNYQASLCGNILGIPVRVGYNYRNRGRFLTHRLELKGFEGKHVVFHYLDLLRLIGISAEDPVPFIHTAPKTDEWADRFLKERGLDRTILVGIVPGGGLSWGESARYRRWPVANFAHVTDKLIHTFGDTIILFGDAKEEKLCANMQDLMKKTVINMGGRTSINEFMSLVKRCAFIVCNEGGPLHLAVALGVPTVSLFGPVDETVYGPVARHKEHHIIVTDRTKCAPCYSRFKHEKCELVHCLNQITVDKVFNAARELRSVITRKGDTHGRVAETV